MLGELVGQHIIRIWVSLQSYNVSSSKLIVACRKIWYDDSLNCLYVDFMIFNRLLEERVRGLAATFPAVVLTGARQVGKTTLLRRLFPTHAYVSLDLPSEAQLAELEPDSFLARYPGPLLIDEVQYAPKLFRHLKVAIDSDRSTVGRFILTGSQKFSLMKEVSDSLAGRVAILELEGLSCQELAAQGEIPPWSDLLWMGSYPGVWANRDISPIEFYRSYLATYLERDVRQLINITSLRDFERFLRACAARSGQTLNKTELGRDVGITEKTVTQWLSVLCASNQVSLLEPFFTNVTKRLTKSPKLYINDTGLLCFLLGLSKDSISAYSGVGSIWESFVYSELRKLREAYAIESSLWFYRDASQREVDFIIDWKGKLTLIEAKWSETPLAADMHALRTVATLFGERVASRIVACRAARSFPIGEGVRALSGTQLVELFE